VRETQARRVREGAATHESLAGVKCHAELGRGGHAGTFWQVCELGLTIEWRGAGVCG
jgi:hypothetical protein